MSWQSEKAAMRWSLQRCDNDWHSHTCSFHITSDVILSSTNTATVTAVVKYTSWCNSDKDIYEIDDIKTNNHLSSCQSQTMTWWISRFVINMGFLYLQASVIFPAFFLSSWRYQLLLTLMWRMCDYSTQDVIKGRQLHSTFILPSTKEATMI